MQEQNLPVCWTEKDSAKVPLQDMRQKQKKAGKWGVPLPRVGAQGKTEVLSYSNRKESKEAKEELEVCLAGDCCIKKPSKWANVLRRPGEASGSY